MKKRLLTLLLTLTMVLSLLPIMGVSAKADTEEFYAVYDTNGTLSFYYDNNKSKHTDTIYDNLPIEATDDRDWPYSSIRNSVKKVVIDSSVANYHDLKSTAYMFDVFIDATNITGCEYLDVSNVTNMSNMFYSFGSSSKDFNVVPNVSGWNTSNVKDMSGVFAFYAERSTTIDTVPNVANWNTSNVTQMTAMFDYYAYSSTVISAVPNVSNFDTSNVTNMEAMFYCYGHASENTLDILNVSNWNITSLTNASNMFGGYAKHNTGVPIISGSDWSTTKSGVTATDMFKESKLKGNTNGDWASANTSNTGCFATTEFYAVYDSSQTLTFYYDINKSTRTGTIYDNLPTEATEEQSWGYYYVRNSIKNVVIDPSVANYHGLKSTAFMFDKMISATNITGCEYLDVSNVTNMSYMFSYFASSNSITDFNIVPNVSNWDTSKVTNMKDMFLHYADNSTTLTAVPDVSKWDTSNVTTMFGMFEYYAHASTIVTAVPDVSNWNTRNVKSMEYMFGYYGHASANTLETLDLSNWDITSLNNTSNMFLEYAKNNTGVPVISGSDWSTIKATGVTATEMFKDSKLKGNTNGDWASANTSDTGCFTKAEFYAVFNTAEEAGKVANTLSFYYDSNKSSRTGTVYADLPKEATKFTDWGYNNIRNSIKNVVIDPSVANYHGLKSTALMFGSMQLADNISGCEYLDVSSVTNMDRMFYCYAKLSKTIIDVPNVSNWDTSNVTDMSGMFDHYAYLSTVITAIPDVSNWDTSNVTSLKLTFGNYAYSSTVITAIPDVSNWDTSNVENMTEMFSWYAYKSEGTLQTLDLSNWDISKLTNTKEMFKNYASGNANKPIVYGTDWSEVKTTGVTATDMFKGSKLKGTTSGNWASANTNTDGCFTAKQNLEFASERMSKKYGAANFTQAVRGAKTTVTYSIGTEGVASIDSSTGEVTILKAGTTTITATVPVGEVGGKSYGGASTTYTLTVLRRQVVITSGSSSKTYDGTPLTNNTFTVSGDGFVSGEGVTCTYTGTITGSATQTGVLVEENTFKYKLNDNTLASNYIITKVNGTLAIIGKTESGDMPYDPIKGFVATVVKGNASVLTAHIAKGSKTTSTIKVRENGKDIPKDGYTVEEGSVKIKFQKSYLNGLSVGQHVFKIYVDGDVYKATITIKNPDPTPYKPVPTGTK